MVQVVQGKEGFGSLLGRHIGGGLQESLGALAQNKLQNMINQQRAAQIAPGLKHVIQGIGDQEANELASLPPDLLNVVIKNYLQAAESAGLDQALQGLSGQNLPDQSDISLEALAEAPVQQPKNPFASMQEIASSLTQPKPTPEKTERAALAPEKPKTVADLLRSPRLTPEHRLKLAGLQQQRQQHLEKLSEKQQSDVDKETKPFYDEVSKGAKVAKENNIRLGRMEELIKRGKINAPFWISTLENLKEGLKIPVVGGTIALDLTAALHPDTQEFQKLSTDFIKGAKEYFGNRITENEVLNFLKTVPNVAQSDEGKRRVIQNLRSFNEIALLRKKASDAIIKENGGRRPRDYESLVEERIAPQVDNIAKEFKENTSNNEGLLRKIPVVGGLLRSIRG